MAAGLLLRLVLGSLIPALVPLPSYFLAVVVATFICGRNVGIFTTALATIGAADALLDWYGAPASFIGNLLFFVVISLLIVWFLTRVDALLETATAEARSRRRHEDFIASQNEILSSIATGAPLPEIFADLVRSIEGYSDFRMLGSILLLDPDGVHLRHGAAPSLPDAYNRAIDGITIGPAAGSCGTAAFLKKTVIVADIEADPLWKEWRDHALAHGLRACWSVPILSSSSTVLGTFAVYHRTPRLPTPEQLDVVSLINKTAAVAIESDRQRAREKLLVHELNHRFKNSLAIVQGIAFQTLRHATDTEALQNFSSRLVSFSRAHELLLKTTGESVDLDELVSKTILEPFASHRHRVGATGPPLRLPPRCALLLAMALHELFTNALKYGALANDDGTVSILWTIDHDETAAATLQLTWREAGGPKVYPPTRKGFGSRLIEEALAVEIKGRVTLDYGENGLVCRIEAPLSGETAGPGPPPGEGRKALASALP